MSYATKGCYGYSSGAYAGCLYYGLIADSSGSIVDGNGVRGREVEGPHDLGPLLGTGSTTTKVRPAGDRTRAARHNHPALTHHPPSIYTGAAGGRHVPRQLQHVHGRAHGARLVESADQVQQLWRVRIGTRLEQWPPHSLAQPHSSP